MRTKRYPEYLLTDRSVTNRLCIICAAFLERTAQGRHREKRKGELPYRRRHSNSVWECTRRRQSKRADAIQFKSIRGGGQYRLIYDRYVLLSGKENNKASYVMRCADLNSMPSCLRALALCGRWMHTELSQVMADGAVSDDQDVCCCSAESQELVVGV